MAVEALSIAFPDTFKAVASRKAAFPVNLPALKEEQRQDHPPVDGESSTGYQIMN